jgi:hypothetical protein
MRLQVLRGINARDVSPGPDLDLGDESPKDEELVNDFPKEQREDDSNEEEDTTAGIYRLRADSRVLSDPVSSLVKWEIARSRVETSSRAASTPPRTSKPLVDHVADEIRSEN